MNPLLANLISASRAFGLESSRDKALGLLLAAWHCYDEDLIDYTRAKEYVSMVSYVFGDDIVLDRADLCAQRCVAAISDGWGATEDEAVRKIIAQHIREEFKEG